MFSRRHVEADLTNPAVHRSRCCIQKPPSTSARCFSQFPSLPFPKLLAASFIHQTWPSCVHKRNTEKSATTAHEYERIIRKVPFPHLKLPLDGSGSHEQHPTGFCRNPTRATEHQLEHHEGFYLPLTPTSLCFGNKDSLEVCRSKYAVLGRNKP